MFKLVAMWEPNQSFFSGYATSLLQQPSTGTFPPTSWPHYWSDPYLQGPLRVSTAAAAEEITKIQRGRERKLISSSYNDVMQLARGGGASNACAQHVGHNYAQLGF